MEKGKKCAERRKNDNFINIFYEENNWWNWENSWQLKYNSEYLAYLSYNMYKKN